MRTGGGELVQRIGIVMNLQAKTAIVLTKDGEFCKIPRTPDLVLGTEVTWNANTIQSRLAILKQAARRGMKPQVWRTAAAAGLAACLVGGLAVWQLVGHAEQAYAYVAVDISPSVKVAVDQKLRILSWGPTDSDGHTLLGKMHLHRGEPLQTFIHDLVLTAVDSHMIPTRDHILVATAPGSANASTDDVTVQHVAQTAVESALTNQSARNLHPEVVSIAMPGSVWRAADRLKVSPAKFATFVAARKKGLNVHLNDLNGSSTMNKVLTQLSVGASNTVTVDLKTKPNPPGHVDGIVHPVGGTQVKGASGTDNATGTKSGEHSGKSQGIHHPVSHPTPADGTTGQVAAGVGVSALSGNTGAQSPGDTSSHVPGSGKGLGQSKGNHDDGSPGGKGHDSSGRPLDAAATAVAALDETDGSVVISAVPQSQAGTGQPGPTESGLTDKHGHKGQKPGVANGNGPTDTASIGHSNGKGPGGPPGNGHSNGKGLAKGKGHVEATGQANGDGQANGAGQSKDNVQVGSGSGSPQVDLPSVTVPSLGDTGISSQGAPATGASTGSGKGHGKGHGNSGKNGNSGKTGKYDKGLGHQSVPGSGGLSNLIQNSGLPVVNPPSPVSGTGAPNAIVNVQNPLNGVGTGSGGSAANASPEPTHQSTESGNQNDSANGPSPSNGQKADHGNGKAKGKVGKVNREGNPQTSGNNGGQGATDQTGGSLDSQLSNLRQAAQTPENAVLNDLQALNNSIANSANALSGTRGGKSGSNSGNKGFGQHADRGSKDGLGNGLNGQSRGGKNGHQGK